MADSITETRGKLKKESERLAKLTAKARGYPRHSAKRHYFKEQAQKVKGRIYQLQQLLDKLIRRKKKRQRGPNTAVKWALRQVGTTEHPPNSNWGEPVETWIKHTGYSSPVPWCGCFASEAVVTHGKAKVPNRNRCGYGPYVMADAAAGRNGFTEVPFGSARAGDYLIFWNGEHQGICRGKPSGDTIPTVEGNTSPASSGSQYNGGCVAAKTRHRSDVSCVARPAY